MPDPALPFDDDLIALQAHVAVHGVDEAACKLANALDERFTVFLGLTQFEHGILALIGQALGQRGVSPDDIIVGDHGVVAPIKSGIAGPLLGTFLCEAKHPAWIRRYVAFQASWWRR